MEDVYDAAIETVARQEAQEAKLEAKNNAQAVIKNIEKESQQSRQNIRIQQNTGRGEVKSCIQVEAPAQGKLVQKSENFQTRNSKIINHGVLNSSGSQDFVAISARQETPTSNQDQKKSHLAAGLPSQIAPKADANLKQSKTSLVRANPRANAHVHPKLAKNQKIYYEESKEEEGDETQRTARQKSSITIEKRARPASLTFGQQVKSKEAKALGNLLGGKLIAKLLQRLDGGRDGLILFSPRNRKILYGRSQEPTRVEFSERSVNSSKKPTQVTDSAKEPNQKSAKTKQPMVMEKPPLGKVPKLKLDFAANDKTNGSRLNAAHNMDSKKVLDDVSMATIAVENDLNGIGINSSILQSHDPDAQTARKIHSRRLELQTGSEIGGPDRIPAGVVGAIQEQKQLVGSNKSYQTGRQDVPGLSQEADSRSKAMSNTGRNMLTKLVESEIFPQSQYDPSAISFVTTPQMISRPKEYEAPLSPGQTFDLVRQLTQSAQMVLPDQEQSTIFHPQINQLYTGVTNLDGTPTDEGEAQSLRLRQPQNESSVQTPINNMREKVLNEQAQGVQFSGDKLLDLTSNSVVHLSNKIERKQETLPNSSEKSASQVCIDTGFREFGQPFSIGKEIGATNTKRDQIEARDPMIDGVGVSRDEIVSSQTQNNGQKEHSSPLVSPFLSEQGFEKELKDNNEGISAVTARNSQQKHPQRTSIKKERNSNAPNVEKESSDPFERAVDSMSTQRQGNQPALVESEVAMQATNRESEEALELGAFNPDVGSSLVLEKTERVEASPAQAPVPRAAFDLTMAGPSLLLEQQPTLFSRPNILRNELVVEDDPISSGDETALYVPPVEDIAQELNPQAENDQEYLESKIERQQTELKRMPTVKVDQLQNVIEASTIQKKTQISFDNSPSDQLIMEGSNKEEEKKGTSTQHSLQPDNPINQQNQISSTQQSNISIQIQGNKQVDLKEPTHEMQARHNDNSEILGTAVMGSSTHNMAERQREEDSDNMLLAIECVNDWAERIVNRSWTQSQKQEEVQSEKKAQDEVIQVKEIKPQEQEVEEQVFAKSIDIQDVPQVEEARSQVEQLHNNQEIAKKDNAQEITGDLRGSVACIDNVQVEDLESPRHSDGEIDFQRISVSAPDPSQNNTPQARIEQNEALSILVLDPIGRADADQHYGSTIKLLVQDQESQASSLFQHIQVENTEKTVKEQSNQGGNTNQVKNGDADLPRGKINSKITTPAVESIREEDDGEDLDEDEPMKRGEYGRATACFKRPSNKSDQVEVRAQRPTRNTQMKSLTCTLEEKVLKDAIFTEDPDYEASSPAASIKDEKESESAKAKMKINQESGESPIIARKLSLGRTTGAPFRTSKVLSIAANCASLSLVGKTTERRKIQRVKIRGQLSEGAGESPRDRKAECPRQGEMWQDGTDDDHSPDTYMEESDPAALKAVKIIKSSEMASRARKVTKVPGTTSKMKLLKTKTAQQSQTVEELNLDLLMSKQKKKQTPVPMISFPNKVRRTHEQKKSLVSICNSLEQDIILFPGFDSARGKKYFKFLQPSQGSMKQARYPSAGANPTKMMSRSKKKFFLAQQEAKKAELTDLACHKEEIKRPFVFTRPAEPHQTLFLDSPDPANTNQAPKLVSRAPQQSTSSSGFKPQSSHLRLTQLGLTSTKKINMLKGNPGTMSSTKQLSRTQTEPRLAKGAKFLKHPVYVYQSKKSQAQLDFEQEMQQTIQKFPNMRVEMKYQELDEEAEKMAARPPLLTKQHRGSPYNVKTKVGKPSAIQDDNKRRTAGLTSAAHLFGASSPLSANSATPSYKQQYPKFIKVKQKNKI